MRQVKTRTIKNLYQYALMEGEPIYGADLTVTVDYAQDSTDPTIPR